MKQIRFVQFICKSCPELTMTRSYTTVDEYFEIMDNINFDLWELNLNV